MEIIRESVDNHEEFENITYGTVFEYDDYFCIKMDFEAKIEGDERINAVCLNNGKTTYFRPTEIVKIVKASLIVKE